MNSAYIFAIQFSLVKCYFMPRATSMLVNVRATSMLVNVTSLIRFLLHVLREVVPQNVITYVSIAQKLHFA